MIPPFDLKRPETVERALEDVAAGGVPYCGGTELLPAMKIGLLNPGILVDLKPLHSLSGIAERDGSVVIGGASRHRDVARDPLIRRRAPLLAEACARLGNLRVRATGSVAGNLCFAEPRSDVMTALLALNAAVVLRSVRGERIIRVDDFVVDALTTVRAEDELLTEVRIPTTTGPQVYLRFQPAEYPTVCVALAGDAALALTVGAVGSRPRRFEYREIDEVDARVVAEELDITEDLNGADDYKRHLAEVFVRRAVAAWRRSANA